LTREKKGSQRQHTQISQPIESGLVATFISLVFEHIERQRLFCILPANSEEIHFAGLLFREVEKIHSNAFCSLTHSPAGCRFVCLFNNEFREIASEQVKCRGFSVVLLILANFIVLLFLHPFFSIYTLRER
jgi:hypothetical protein